MNKLNENEIYCRANRVKYSHIEYFDNYIVLTQNRICRRIPSGYYFYDNGIYIWISIYYSHIFQHSPKSKTFIINRQTKEWRDFVTYYKEINIPQKLNAIDNNNISELKR